MSEPSYGEALRTINPEKLSDLQLQVQVAHLEHLATHEGLRREEKAPYVKERIRYEDEMTARGLSLEPADGEYIKRLAALRKLFTQKPKSKHIEK